MKKIFTLLLFRLLFGASIYAQTIEGIAGFIKTGYMYAPRSGKTFHQIAPEGIAGFSNNYCMVGAEAYYRKKQNIYAAEGNIGVQKSYSNITRYAEPYNGAAHIKFGKIIAQAQQYWLYPSAGAGVSVMQLLTYDKVNKKVDNIQEKTLVSASFDAGINADLLLSKTKWDKGYYCGWMLGIRAGYRAGIVNSRWKYENEVKSYSMPRYANNAFYIMLTIGGGSFDKR